MTTNGYVAWWRGQEFEASPALEDGRLTIRLYRSDRADGFGELAPGRWVRGVPAGEVDRLSYVVEACSWREEPFHVVSRDDSNRVLLEYVGGQLPVAHRLGLSTVERGVHRIWVPVEEVTSTRLEQVLIGE
ncbi:hypothetical protein [Amycolatopsis taiwanensis]|uniref:hypothetical protein n=1 Tax=Amycolatopsis taiwanensis TaxID=342230 RepID=UPI00048523F8|nr:hypothetical protein [Amycolatopsis taiwanensis]